MAEQAQGKIRFKLAGYYVDGKRIRKYFASEEAANTSIAQEMIRRENLGKRATRIDGALAEDAVRACDLLNATPYTVLDAARLVAEAHQRLAPYAVRIDDAVAAHAATVEERQRSVTVRQATREFIDNRRAKGKSNIYLRDLQTRLSRFTLAFGDRLIAELSLRAVDDWIQSLHVGPQTQNNFRAVLSSLWTFAVRRGYAPQHVIQLIDKSAVVRDHVPIFRVRELKALLSAAPDNYLPVIALGAFAGLRPEEIKKLHWEDLDFDERTIRVNASAAKTRRKRFAEIADNLVAWLRSHAKKSGPVAPPNLQKLRRSTMQAAGIDQWPQDVLRHSFASAHYAFHKNPAHTALLLGHRDQDMLLTHYRDLMKPSEAKEYWTLMPTSRRRPGTKLISITPHLLLGSRTLNPGKEEKYNGKRKRN